jgi:hypothetical protein
MPHRYMNIAAVMHQDVYELYSHMAERLQRVATKYSHNAEDL